MKTSSYSGNPDMGMRTTRVIASQAHLDHIMATRAIVEAIHRLRNETTEP